MAEIENTKNKMSERGNNTVKNRDPAPIQITAEQILRDAKEKQSAEVKTPIQKIQSKEEISEWRFLKRRDFENSIRNQKMHIGNYGKYAKWEESQGELARARNVFERGLDTDPTATSLWIKYAEFEVRNKFINHARNVYDRAVTIMPRVEQLWYKYAYLQEMLGDIGETCAVFERWMDTYPSEQAWLTYIKFVCRCGRKDTARKLYERMIQQIPEESSYIKYAKWEEREGEKSNCRTIFERSLTELSEENVDQDLYMEFARFEIRCHEVERARIIFKYGLEHAVGKKDALQNEYMLFEKQYGNQESIEEVILSKRREQYEEQLKNTPYNYDIWFDYVKMLEEEGKEEKVIDAYERAIANKPPSKEKRFWRRYIYLWIYYAIYLEYDVEEIEKAREVYKRCVTVIPSKHFSFGKIWILSAKFEIRQHSIENARKVLGHSIGVSPKPVVFRFYIDMEYRLMNLDRCRLLYQKWLECDPTLCDAWCRYAEFEAGLDEHERCESIYELAVNQEALDTPEVVWKKYIDYEIEMGNQEKVESLFERLLNLAEHAKVYITYARYESEHDMDKAREILERGISVFKERGENEMRHLLLRALKSLEESVENNEERVEKVTKRQANKVRKTRHNEETGLDEDYYDYVFPDDEKNSLRMRMLAAAQKWSKRTTELDEVEAKRTKESEDINIDAVFSV